MKKLYWVDSLKGIAILGVVLIHAGGSHLPGFWGKIGDAGKFGVQLFFIISAFLTWKSIEDNNCTYIQWLMKKITRLMPLYWVAYIIAIIVGEKPSLKNVIVHITGVWGFFPKYNNFSMAEWYLGAYIIFII